MMARALLMCRAQSVHSRAASSIFMWPEKEFLEDHKKCGLT
jgi:hypothetical protein